jgi:hypothetical protein
MTALHQRPTVRRQPRRPVRLCVRGMETVLAGRTAGRRQSNIARASPSAIVGAGSAGLEAQHERRIGAAQSP